MPDTSYIKRSWAGHEFLVCISIDNCVMAFSTLCFLGPWGTWGIFKPHLSCTSFPGCQTGSTESALGSVDQQQSCWGTSEIRNTLDGFSCTQWRLRIMHGMQEWWNNFMHLVSHLLYIKSAGFCLTSFRSSSSFWFLFCFG